MAPKLSKIGEICLVHLLSQTVFIQSSPNITKIFEGILSQPNSITSLRAQGTFGLWPFNDPKLVKTNLNSFDGRILWQFASLVLYCVFYAMYMWSLENFQIDWCKYCNYSQVIRAYCRVTITWPWNIMRFWHIVIYMDAKEETLMAFAISLDPNLQGVSLWPMLLENACRENF